MGLCNDSPFDTWSCIIWERKHNDVIYNTARIPVSDRYWISNKNYMYHKIHPNINFPCTVDIVLKQYKRAVTKTV